MNYGYARVSSSDQNEARQIIALKEAGIEEKSIYVDKQSGKNFDRPAWKRMKRKIKKGDVLFIKSLDRMGRDYIDVQEQWRQLNKVKGVDIVILDMPLLDTRADKNLVGTLISDIVLQLLAFVAQTERENIKQRQREGIDAAMARGVRFGRPKRDLPDGFEEAFQAYLNGKITGTEAAKECGLPYGTFYTYARQRIPIGVKIQKPQLKAKPKPRKLKKPEHFDEVYFSWINGGMTMEEAAMLLGITEKRFYKLTEAEG